MRRLTPFKILFLATVLASCSGLFRTQWRDPEYNPRSDVMVITDTTPTRTMIILINEIENQSPDSLFAIEGQILDSASDDYLSGADVIVQHTANGATSNYQGYFTVSHLHPNDILDFRRIHFFRKFISVRDIVRRGKAKW